MQVTHDAGGALSNEDNFLREASLCREIFTVVWRYWNTLVVWFGCGAWVKRQLYFFSPLSVLELCLLNARKRREDSIVCTR